VRILVSDIKSITEFEDVGGRNTEDRIKGREVTGGGRKLITRSLIICSPPNYQQMEEEEMCRTCSMHMGREMRTEFFKGRRRESSIEVRVKQIGLHHVECVWLGIRTGSGVLRGGKFLDQLRHFASQEGILRV
jgi:hypothetical protein